MKSLIRRLSKVADSSSSSQYQPLHPGHKTKPNRRHQVPEGHVPVYVGDEMELFAIRADLLNRPGFVDLLTRSAQEYGYSQVGVLRIPCPVPFFMKLLDSEGEVRVESDL